MNMRLLNKGALGAAVILGCSACTDTIDDHYGIRPGTPTQTLWEQIIAQPDLSDFAKVLENTHYYISDEKASNQTYKDILQQNNKLTVWAPVNGTFDVNEYLEQINTNEYDVDHRFIRNHIAVFSHPVSGMSVDSITMLNAKVNLLHNADSTLRDQKITTVSIPATNGLLHKLGGVVEFQSNLYEFMSTDSRVAKLYQYFHDRDTLILDEWNSVQGGIVDGEITWADSVMITVSKAFNMSYEYQGNTWQGINANLKNEDSTYVMVLPTDQAWDEALTKTRKAYNYMEYPYMNFNNNSTTTVDPETYRERYSLMSVVNRLVFSPNQQKDYGLEDFGNTDSLFTTRGEVVDTPYCNNIFKGIVPERLSNAYAYVANEYKYNVASDIEFEGEDSRYWNINRTGNNTINYTPLNKANRNPEISGYVSGNAYVVVARDNDRKNRAKLVLNIPNVLSAKYDIFVVTVPQNIQDTEMTDIKPMKMDVTLRYYKGNNSIESSQSVKNVEVSTEKVDTIPLFKDFTFPVAYMGVEGAYPLLEFQASGALVTRNANRLMIDKIILRAKNEE